MVADANKQGNKRKMQSPMAKASKQVERKQQSLNARRIGTLEINQPLKQEVREALLNSLRDKDATASARVAAARTLLEYYSDEKSPALDKRGAELTAAELDEAIRGLED